MKRLASLPLLGLLMSGLLLISLTGCGEKPSDQKENQASIVGKWLLEENGCGFFEGVELAGDMAKVEFDFTSSGDLYVTVVVLDEVHTEKIGRYSLTKDKNGTQLLRVTDTDGEGMEIEVRHLTKTQLELVSKNPAARGCSVVFKRL